MEKALKKNLTLLRNYLRHASNRTDGRVTRHFERHTHALHVEVSKGGLVRLCIVANRFSIDRRHILDVRLRGENVTIDGTRIEEYGMGFARQVALMPAQTLKLVRGYLKNNFPGYTKKREEWVPPCRIC